MACFADDEHERRLRRSFSYTSSSSASLSNCELEDDDVFFELAEHVMLSRPLKPTSLDLNRATVNRFHDGPSSIKKTELFLHTQRDAQRNDGQMPPDSGIALPPACDRDVSLQPRLKLRTLSVEFAASAPSERAAIDPVAASPMCSWSPSRRRTLSVESAASAQCERATIQPVTKTPMCSRSLSRRSTFSVESTANARCERAVIRLVPLSPTF